METTNEIMYCSKKRNLLSRKNHQGWMPRKIFGALFIVLSLSMGACNNKSKAPETITPDSPPQAPTAPDPKPAPPVATAPPANDEALILAVAAVTKDYPNVIVEVDGNVIVLKGQVEKMRHAMLIATLKALKPGRIDESGLVIK
ncbi:MAG: hypothetical protein ABWZ25_02145 [Chitinophagaceae bacterium]